MQEMQRADGTLMRELFSAAQVQDGGAQRRREALERAGYRFVSLKPVKYQPHQGAKEIARRLRRMQKAVAEAATDLQA